MKNATYSHGLEKIYAFETVNPQTVRTLNVKQTEIAPNPETTLSPAVQQKQLFFSFIPELPFLRLKEPIEVLELSTYTQKGLLTVGKKTVEEALELIQSKEHSFKGLGLGHIEEIQTKLSAYLKPRARPSVDFSALCRILCHFLDPKERFILLAHSGLQSLFSMPLSEIQELERWTSAQKRQAFHRAIEKCQKVNGHFLQSVLKQIADAYLAIWIQERHGLVTASEFIECLRGLSSDPDLFDGAIQLLTLLSAPKPLPEQALCQVEQNIYAASTKVQKEFILVCQKAFTYFYQPFVTYPLETLAAFIKNDFARAWIGFEQGFIEKVLTTSSHFVYGNGEILRSFRELLLDSTSQSY